MLDFFNMLSDLIESDLVVDNIGVIVSFQIIVIVLSCFLTWVFLTKIIWQIRLNEAANKEAKFAEMQEKISLLEEKNQKLEKQLEKFKFERALEDKESELIEQAAFERFRRK